MGGMGSMSGFGATMETIGGMGGFGAPPGGLDGMGGMGGMSFASLIGGMVHLRAPVCHLRMKMPLNILETPSELHVMRIRRATMKRGRKNHLRRSRMNRRKMRMKMKTRTRLDCCAFRLFHELGLHFELGGIMLLA